MSESSIDTFDPQGQMQKETQSISNYDVGSKASRQLRDRDLKGTMLIDTAGVRQSQEP